MTWVRWCAVVGVLLLASTGCGKNKSLIRVPIAEPPRAAQQGPATEHENQSTSMPIMVETLPQPAPTGAEVKPNIPPPAKPIPPQRPKAVLEVRREPKTSPASETTAPPAGVAGIQLTPQISQDERAEMMGEIREQLESARARMKSINKASLSDYQKANLAAVKDFVNKSEDSLKRGDFQQSLVLARKANTLAGSLQMTP
jgi:hypothetical protein